MLRLLPFFAILVALSTPLPAAAVTVVPPGNRHAEQPPVPGASARRTEAMRTTFEAKYRKIHDLLRDDRRLRSEIEDAARAYGIAPTHIVGALVGEHTFNVDVYDRLQTYYVKAMAYAGQTIRFTHDGEPVTDFVERPQFSRCAGIADSYGLWTCREDVWDESFRGQRVDGTVWPNDRFSAVFFQPFYAGQTFGLGQLNPLTALKMSDKVHAVSGLARLSADDPGAVYEAIMNPKTTLPYVAADLRHAIDAYRTIADLDITGNPGITATLYNLGGADARARAAKRRGGLPEENFYGWFVNEKLEELELLF